MSVSQQRFNRFVRPLTDRLRSRGQKKGDDQSSSRSAPAPLIFETLEPRILLAADPLGITAGYAFDETSGTTAADASGHGITGTLTNGPTFTPGKNGNAVTLDGVNDYVNLGNPTALQFTGSMTVGAWVYASAFPADDAAVVSKRAAGEVGFQLDITKDTGPRTIGFKLTDSTGGQMLRYGATTLQLNTWYYITGVYNAVNQSLDVYLNGALDNGTLQGTVTSSQQNSTANVTIGRRAGATGFEFNGRIDDVRIADHALTQDQIQTDMVTPLGPSGPDVTAPTVSLTAPAANATIAGTVTVSASASDNVGVASVQFLLDGTNLGSRGQHVALQRFLEHHNGNQRHAPAASAGHRHFRQYRDHDRQVHHCRQPGADGHDRHQQWRHRDQQQKRNAHAFGIRCLEQRHANAVFQYGHGRLFHG